LINDLFNQFSTPFFNVSLAPDSINANRGVDILVKDPEIIRSLSAIFEKDFKATTLF